MAFVTAPGEALAAATGLVEVSASRGCASTGHGDRGWIFSACRSVARRVQRRALVLGRLVGRARGFDQLRRSRPGQSPVIQTSTIGG